MFTSMSRPAALLLTLALAAVGVTACNDDTQAADRGEAADQVQTAKVVVTELGFEPEKVTLKAGIPAKITFVRTTEKTCGTEVIFDALKIERKLPLNEPVTVEFTPAKAGDIAFACGMNMLRGTVVIVQQ
jgi:plastocyanin domain-containing protein